MLKTEKSPRSNSWYRIRSETCKKRQSLWARFDLQINASSYHEWSMIFLFFTAEMEQNWKCTQNRSSEPLVIVICFALFLEQCLKASEVFLRERYDGLKCNKQIQTKMKKEFVN